MTSALGTHSLDSSEQSAGLGANQPFLLAGRDVAWLVEHGGLDIFLVRLQDGVPNSARFHVLRVEPGACAFSVAAEVTGSYGLLACATADARIAKFSLAALRETDARLAIQYVERWSRALSEAARPAIAPTRGEALEVGNETTLEASKAAALNSGMALARIVSGSAAFFGMAEYPLEPLPPGTLITQHDWIVAAGECRVACVSLAEWNESDNEWLALSSFHRRILGQLAAAAEQRRAAAATRLHAQREQDWRMIAHGAEQLAAPFLQQPPESPASTSGNALLTACRAIGDFLHIEFREVASTSQTVQRNLERIARVSRVRYRSVVLRDQWWRADQGPLLAFQQGAPVALIPDSPSSYYLLDPQTGRRSRVHAAAAQALDPIAYCFYRNLPARSITPLDLVRFGIHGCTRDGLAILLTGLAAGALSLFTPIFTGILFDSVIPNADRVQLIEVAAILIVAAISSTLLAMTRNIAMMRAESRASHAVQAAVWDRLLDMPASFFRRYTSADLAMRAMGIDSIRQVLTGTVMSGIFSSLFSLVSFGLLFYYSTRLALLATGITGIAIVLALLSGYIALRRQREIIAANGRLSTLVLQIIQGVTKLRVAAAEDRAWAIWARELAKNNALAVRSALLSNRLNVFNSAFSILSTVAIFYTTAHDAGMGALTTGQFLAFSAAFGQYFGGMLSLTGSLLGVLSVIPLLERARPLLNTLPEVADGNADPGDLTGAVEVNHVSFRYHKDAPLVLNDVTLTVQPGEFAAIVGASGCGKSTLVRVLLGFEKPEAGAVYFDDKDLSQLDVQSVRRQMGVVIQNGTILPGDIRTNITGSAPLTLEDAWDAARLAGLEADIKAMPMGMHTTVGEGGSGLSGGQRQRLMIARALANRPRILIFDEATSALDNRTQEIVSESMRRLKATRIVIAHRLSTVVHADRIYVIQAGSVVQTGTYEELILQPGLFAELAKRQLT